MSKTLSCGFVLLIICLSPVVNAQEHHPRFDTIRERIENWEHPSVFKGWAPIFWNLQDELSIDEMTAKLNLHYSASTHYIGGTSIKWSKFRNRLVFIQNLPNHAKAQQDAIMAMNPNHIALAGIAYDSRSGGALPADSELWLRDENGDRIPWFYNNFYYFDYVSEAGQQNIIGLVLDIANTGLYDGCFFDHWTDTEGTPEQIEARINILRGIREKVHPDFLLFGNANVRTLPLSAPYMNGIMIEAVAISPLLPQDFILDIQDVVEWGDRNMREPTINGLGAIVPRAADGTEPRQRQQIRLLTTMVLTQSDGSILYGDRKGAVYDSFFDAPLGSPVGPKSQLIEGAGDLKRCFIREFEHGWAVYNCGSESQIVKLPEVVTSVANGKQDDIHEVAAFDGDIFLSPIPTTPIGVDRRRVLTTLWGHMKLE